MCFFLWLKCNVYRRWFDLLAGNFSFQKFTHVQLYFRKNKKRSFNKEKAKTKFTAEREGRNNETVWMG